jgi:glycosyltransferase involved in cell wall biosynthesis
MKKEHGPIKIAVDARWFDSYYSGVTSYIKGVYSALWNDPRFDITLVTNCKPHLKDEFNLCRKFEQIHSFSRSYRLLKLIPDYIKRNGFDLGHFQYVSPFYQRGNNIVTLHDLLFIDYPSDYPFWFRLQNRYLFYLSAISARVLLTVSEYSRKRIAKHFKIPFEKIHVLPNGYSPWLIQSDGYVDVKQQYKLGSYILCVSRFEPRKNQSSLLKAFISLKLYNRYSLVMIGKITIRDREFDTVFNSMPKAIRARVRIIDNVSNIVLKSFYKTADLTVYPSKSEGFGIPPIESLSLGIQTICSNTTAMADFRFLADKMFNPNCVDDIKGKIVEALADGPRCDDMTRKLVLDKYDWVNISKKFGDIIVKNNGSSLLPVERGVWRPVDDYRR